MTNRTTPLTEKFTSESDMKGFFEHVLDLENGEARLFHGSAGRRVEKFVFLMFPPHLTTEVAVLTKYLQSLDARVYCAGNPGSWARFIQDKKKSGVILYHPSVNNYERVPNLRQTLFQGSYNHFQLGKDDYLLHNDEAATKYSCVRLFPQGTVSLFTDDVFVYHPRKSLEILRKIKATNDLRPTYDRSHRILTRPGIQAFLLQLFEDEQVGRHHDKSDRLKLYLIFDEMMTDKRPLDESDKPSQPFVVSPPVAEMPEYAKLWDANEANATDYLVEYFAGWCLLEKESFRRFMVIHQAKDAPDYTPGGIRNHQAEVWMEKYQHINIYTPEKWKKL